MARMYGIFEKQDGKWVRLMAHLGGFRKETAIRVFQDMLLDGVFTGKIRELRVLPR